MGLPSYFMRQTLTEPEAHNFSNVGWQQVPEICLAVQPKSGVTDRHVTWFSMGAGELNSAFHTCTASTLTHEPSPVSSEISQKRFGAWPRPPVQRGAW